MWSIKYNTVHRKVYIAAIMAMDHASAREHATKTLQKN